MKDLSEPKNTIDSTSMIVNIDKKSRKSEKSVQKPAIVQPRDGDLVSEAGAWTK